MPMSVGSRVRSAPCFAHIKMLVAIIVLQFREGNVESRNQNKFAATQC